jgi:hypothetical protein
MSGADEPSNLAKHDAIAIYPLGGWWKFYVGQRRITDKGRYSLVISIAVPSQPVDLHADIANLVNVAAVEPLLGTS